MESWKKKDKRNWYETQWALATDAENPLRVNDVGPGHGDDDDAVGPGPAAGEVDRLREPSVAWSDIVWDDGRRVSADGKNRIMALTKKVHRNLGHPDRMELGCALRHAGVETSLVCWAVQQT